MGRPENSSQRAGCLQFLLLAFMLLGAVLFFHTDGEWQGTGIDRRGFIYMVALPGACLGWMRLRNLLPRK